MSTIFDTDFDADDEVLLYRGMECAYAGRVGGLDDDLKAEFDVSTWFLLDEGREGYKVLFLA